jgi:TetR/AcrR family transcriptional regulator
MVAIFHGGENTGKLREILEQARKCFSMHGFERTTMKEIASGVFLSKASLYYYFPDKESLFKAVIELEQEEFFLQIGKRLAEVETAEAMLGEFLSIRHEHFKNFINLNIFRFADFHKIKPHVRESFRGFRERETGIVESIIQKGIRSRQFNCRNPKDSAALFLEILQGLRMVVMQHRDYMDLAKEDYDQIEREHQLFLSLFIDSLRKRRSGTKVPASNIKKR